ncbi:probable tRNA (uracil-O(2)-)-methyltransferase isoform X2 [Sabethes cyaneus]|uniref:probable tRNA (uracil-O(2)-)-methyltransferase isoform X2 n=1 Tax=Sabethes cyaneus TaxID=53552 RepID=UPI00237D974F|nr:probable tRNA (uracil-O(2)-)-methyltransferase isoform X2 [Sabethes cyaneus]
MFDKKLVSRNVLNITKPHFYRAVNIYLFKPHVLNRKLFGANNFLNFTFRQMREDSSLDAAGLLENFKVQFEKDQNHETVVSALAQKYNLDVEKLPDGIELHSSLNEDQGYFVFNRLLPRNLDAFRPLDMLTIIDPVQPSASFICLHDKENILAPKFAFSIQMNGQELSIKCTDSALDTKSIIWLTDVLFPRLLKWIDTFSKQENQGFLKEDINSLSMLFNIEEYNQLYGKLKTKYGVQMVEKWPEGTDPKKFVYEDVAIASYLLLLWKQEREINGSDRLQSFVDVGCGNGLLVYILASEGHDGTGIDLRKRKIWDLYPDKIKLIEKPLIPDAELFPHADWIIGNHSDELSPWIPVLAARSSYQCRYFLLPCCAFEFDGSKFQRQNSSVSQYNDFLNYVKHISEVCGFKTDVDRLKIPSTKRICVVGSKRTYTAGQFNIYCDNIQKFISSRVSSGANVENQSLIFKLRECTEKVRNCTKVDRSVVDDIVAIVFNALIAKKRIASEFPEKNWNAGGTIALGGCVQLRIPTKCGQSSKTTEELRRKVKQKNAKHVNFKERACWHFSNHPDGCPFDECDCKFKH